MTNQTEYMKEMAKDAIEFGSICAMDGMIPNTDQWYSVYLKTHPIPYTKPNEIDWPGDSEIMTGAQRVKEQVHVFYFDKAVFQYGAEWMRDLIRERMGGKI